MHLLRVSVFFLNFLRFQMFVLPKVSSLINFTQMFANNVRQAETSPLIFFDLWIVSWSSNIYRREFWVVIYIRSTRHEFLRIAMCLKLRKQILNDWIMSYRNRLQNSWTTLTQRSIATYWMLNRVKKIIARQIYKSTEYQTRSKFFGSFIFRIINDRYEMDKIWFHVARGRN